MNTLEKLFRKSVRGLAKQGFGQALNSNQGCAYRGESGRKCAVGHLIPNSKYTPKMEGVLPDMAGSDIILKGCGLSNTPAHRNFLTQLQICHDQGMTPVSMKFKLKEFAFKNEFTVPKELE